MATLTRQQIIDLINQYIYTNGNQRITATQMNEILLAIAKAFAMDGSATGIDSVLAAGSNVIAGRKITNAQGGSVNLSATYTVEDNVFNYVGFDAASASFEGATYTGMERSIMGNLKRSSPSRNFLEMIGQQSLNPGEVLAAAYYQAKGVSGEGGPSDGVHLKTVYEDGKSELGVCTDFLYTNVTQDNEVFSYTNQYLDNIHAGVVNGPQSTYHVQNVSSYETKVLDEDAEFSKLMNLRNEIWNNQDGSIFQVNSKGIKLSQSKKLALTSGGSAATAGLVTLDGGTATIMTTAVSAGSIISLTVQEAGLYMGNIRVSAKVNGTSFTISTSQDIDTCSVFWQIIDL